MKKIFFLLLVLSFILPYGKMYAQQNDYSIKRGDVIDVVVMEHPEFTISGITVLPDGTIQYPAFGSVVVAGMSTQILRDSLETMLDKYIVNPMVSIFVRRLHDQRLNVMGYVNRPGQFQIFEGTDIISAIGLAGGIKNLKKAKKVVIIRADQTSETINIKKIFEGKNGNKALPVLYAGDTLYIGEPREFNWARLSFIASALTTVLTLIRVLQ